MAQKGFLVDLKRCTGCKGCQIACKSENNTRPQPGASVHGASVDYRRVVFSNDNSGDATTVVRRFVSTACYHCDMPACLSVCPVGAISKRSTDGVVLIDYDACIGCRRCFFACPYNAPRYNGAQRKTQKCTYCEHLDAGLTPACVATCVSKALLAVDDTSAFTETFDADDSTRPEGTPNDSAKNGPPKWTQSAAAYSEVLGENIDTGPNVWFAADSSGNVEQK